MHSRAIAVLRVLDEKHHQKGHDGGASIDDQLPGVAEPKQRSSDEPHRDRRGREHEGYGVAHATGHPIAFVRSSRPRARRLWGVRWRGPSISQSARMVSGYKDSGTCVPSGCWLAATVAAIAWQSLTRLQRDACCHVCHELPSQLVRMTNCHDMRTSWR